MMKFVFYIKLTFGIIFLTISSFVGLFTVLVILGKNSAFGVNLKIMIIFLRGNDGAASMIPIFIGMLAIAGVFLIRDNSTTALR